MEVLQIKFPYIILHSKEISIDKGYDKVTYGISTA